MLSRFLDCLLDPPDGRAISVSCLQEPTIPGYDFIALVTRDLHESVRSVHDWVVGLRGICQNEAVTQARVFVFVGSQRLRRTRHHLMSHKLGVYVFLHQSFNIALRADEHGFHTRYRLGQHTLEVLIDLQEDFVGQVDLIRRIDGDEVFVHVEDRLRELIEGLLILIYPIEKIEVLATKSLVTELLELMRCGGIM